MVIETLQTETEYEAALEAIRRLWNSEPGTPEGERLDILIALVEAYEDKHYPIGK